MPISWNSHPLRRACQRRVGCEREVRDMYGLIPVGLPDERRLMLPDDWPDELYPLRKDSMDYRQRPAPTAMRKPPTVH